MSQGSVNESLRQQKDAIRAEAFERRKSQPDKDEVSRKICARFMELPAYDQAATVMFYVDARSEVRTRHVLPDVLGKSKRIVVPYCVDGFLHLFHLESMEELELGMYKILEPKTELRQVPEKRIDVRELDLVMVPGVAFTRTGARMGHGKGYYDKLLENARSDAPLVALAFECQIFESIPTGTHDIFMDQVVTEQDVYAGKGRGDGRGN